MNACSCGHARLDHSGLSVGEPCRLCGCKSYEGTGRDPIGDLIIQSPGVRARDPWTSHEAAAAQTPRKNGPLHAAILLALSAHPGHTDEWLIETLTGPESSIQTRRHELQEAGLVVDTGVSKSRYGRRMLEWSLSPVGVDFVRSHTRELVELRDRRKLYR